jgi:hypothetical protein
MLQPQSLQIADFSGGITDYPFDAALTQAEELDNFVINPNQKALMRPGSQIYSVGMAQVPDGVARISNLTTVATDDIFYATVGQKVYHPNAGDTAWVEVQAPGANPAFNAGSLSSIPSFAEWNRQLFGVNDAYAKPIKIFKNSVNTPIVRTAGLPAPATPTVVPGAAGANSYIYTFVRRVEYTVQDTEFADLSATVQVQILNSAAPDATPVPITNIPVLVNSGGTAYDTATLKVDIYRTTSGGNVAYKIGTVTNGTTTFNDNFADTAIVLNETVYTTGGTLDYDEPPLARYIHIMNGRAYYLDIKEGTQLFRNRVRQSIQDDPDSCPEDFFLDLREVCTGISSFNSNVIIFGESKVFRVDGYFDELGRGGMTYEEISKVTGCVSHSSIVQTRDGVLFFGNDGVYWTDGFVVKKISDSINERYKAFVSDPAFLNKITGVYDAIESRVVWSVQKDQASGDNDSCLVLDLRYPIREASTFTTWSNGDFFAPSALCVFRNQLLRADYRGFLFKHDSDYASDPRVDTLVTPEDWDLATIIWNYKSVAFNFGLPMVRKWVAQILTTIKNISAVSVLITSINDDSTVEDELKEIRFRDTCVWGQEEIIWDTDTIKWASFGLIEQRRRFPAGGLRCSYKQIRITNAYTNIFNSDAYGTVTIDRTAKTATLDDPTMSWPQNLIDYDLCLQGSDTDPEYTAYNLPIAERVSDTVLLLLDPSNRLAVEWSTINFDDNKWIIKGKPKGEILHLMSYVLYYSPLTPTQRTYQGTKSETGVPS